MTVGVISPLTGPYAAVGTAYVNGVKAGADYVNANGGINGKTVKLDIKDDAGNPTQDVAAVRQLLSEKVTAVVAAPTTASSQAIASMVNQAKVPTFTPSPGFPWQDGAAANPFVFNTGWSNSSQNDLWFHYFAKDRKLTNVGMITTTDAFGQEAIKQAKVVAEKYGVTLNIEQIDPHATDVTAQLNNLKSAGSQGALLALFGTPLVTALHGLEAIAWDPVLVGLPDLASSAARSSVNPKTLQDAGSGPFAIAYVQPSENPRLTALLDGLVALGGQDAINGSQGNATFGFDALVLLKAGADLAKSQDGEAIKTALEKGEALAGAGGEFRYTAESHAAPADQIALVQVTNGCTRLCAPAPSFTPVAQ